ncbi:MAG TPA: hypothetical protein VJ729_02205 [Nitrososphaeraceae archaeon]|nr:hypothetical protein [Nitrososphaeraceae archaeon]
MFTLFHTNIHSVKYHILDDSARCFTTILFDFVLLIVYGIYEKERDKNIHIQLAQKRMRNVDAKTPIYDLPCIYDVYNRKLTNWQYLGSSGGYEMKINNRRIVAVPFTESISNNTRRKRG